MVRMNILVMPGKIPDVQEPRMLGDYRANSLGLWDATPLKKEAPGSWRELIPYIFPGRLW